MKKFFVLFFCLLLISISLKAFDPIRISIVSTPSTSAKLVVDVLNSDGTSKAPSITATSMTIDASGVLSLVLNNPAWTSYSYSANDLLRITFGGVVLSIERMEVVIAKQSLFGATISPSELDQTLSGLVVGAVASNTAITAGTNTKITYDAKGLVTAGTAATTADIAASTNNNYVTDAKLAVLNNTSNTNTGDQTNVTGTASNVTGIVLGANGGTGIDNTGKTITLGGNLTTGGAAATTTLTSTATTNVTLPTTGTLATLGGVESITGLKTFDNSKIAMKGTSTGVTTLSTANVSANPYTITLPAATGTVALTSDITSGWALTGNAGTGSSNFIGTTDDKPFNVRVNNEKAGRIDRALANTFWGYHAGNLTTGVSNTAIGVDALYSNTTGTDNTAIGVAALYSNTIGTFNTAIGRSALYSNTGTYNTAIGQYALNTNITGTFNTAIGYAADVTSTTLTNVTAIGSGARVNASNNVQIGNSDVTDVYFGNGTTTVLHGTMSTAYLTPSGSGASLTGITSAQVGAPSGSGTSTGTNSGDQTLVSLGAVASNTAITAGTNTKITYDAKGLVTAGAAATTADIAASTNKNYVTDAQKTVIGNIPALTLGQSYQGGKIFWLDATGQHGLIAATTDQSTGILWHNSLYRYTGTTGDGLYAGSMNTAMIVATQMADNQQGNFAAKVCADYSVTDGVVTYGDWCLPSKYELNLLYQQRAWFTGPAGFASAYYWSSTEDYNNNSNYAWAQEFPTGIQYYTNKNYAAYVRAIRAF